MSAATSHLELARFARTHIRRLAPPTTRRHPDSERLEADLRRWAVDVGLYPGGDRHQLVLRQVGRAVGCTMPDAPFRLARLTAHYLAWVFAFDDTVAERGVLLAVHRAMRLPELLCAGPRPGGLAPRGAVATLAALREEIIEHGGGALLPRLRDEMRRYLDACAEEAPWRRTGRPPSLRDYLRDRTATTGGHPMLLHRLAPGMPPLHDPLPACLDGLVDQAFLIAGLVNDLLGFALEQRRGDPVNVIPVLANEYALTQPEAYLSAVDLHAAHVHRFRADLAAVVSDPGLTGPQRTLATAVGGWVDGTAAATEPYWQRLVAEHGS